MILVLGFVVIEMSGSKNMSEGAHSSMTQPTTTMSVPAMHPPATGAPFVSREAAAEALVGLFNAPTETSGGGAAPEALAGAAAPSRSNDSFAPPVAPEPTVLHVLPQNMYAPQYQYQYVSAPPCYWPAAVEQSMQQNIQPGMINPVHPGLLRGDSFLLSQIKPTAIGACAPMPNWNALVHPRGHDVLAKQPPPLTPVSSTETAIISPKAETLQLQSPSSSPPRTGTTTTTASTPSAGKRRRSGKGDGSKFSWVILQTPPSKAEQAAGVGPAQGAPGEKPLKKLRGHAGYAWKPL